MKKYSEQIQRFGRSLLLPIGVMAPVGLLLGVSAAFTQSYMIELLPFLGNPILKLIFDSIRQISDLIFGNIPIMFAMGVAYGMARREKGIAVFSSVMAYLVLLITMKIWLSASGQLVTEGNIAVAGQASVLGIQTLNVNVLGGIIAGLVAAWAADKFYNLDHIIPLNLIDSDIIYTIPHRLPIVKILFIINVHFTTNKINIIPS